MATIVGAAVANEFEQQDSDQSLILGVPAPFPVDRLVELGDEALHDLAVERAVCDAPEAPRNIDVGSAAALNDIKLSIAAVQRSCFMTLANHFSVSVIPPSAALGSATQEHVGGYSPVAHRPDTSVVEPWSMESSLAALVHTLRTRDGVPESHLSQPCSSADAGQDGVDDAGLLAQLHDLVDMLAPSMRRCDTLLAQAIVDLLVDLQQLPSSFALASASSCSPCSTRSLSHASSTSSVHTIDGPHAILTSFQKKLSSLQPAVTTSSSHATSTAPIQTVQPALLWARIDQHLETIVQLCNTRPSAPSCVNSNSNPFCDPNEVSGMADAAVDAREAGPSTFHENHLLPPQYEYEGGIPHDEVPPAYFVDQAPCQTHEPFVEDKKALLESECSPLEHSDASTTSLPVLDAEKPAALDLDLVTRAIDRLYEVAPQLTNQRVELRSEKISQMQRAQQEKGKNKLPGDADLDKMLDLLGRASAREITDQRAVVDPRRSGRVKGHGELVEQRETYIEYIVQRSSAGRLRSQDAEPSLALQTSSLFSLSVSSVALGSEVDAQGSSRDKNATTESTIKPDGLTVPSDKKLRTRSVSAPHLAWLRSASRDRSGTGGSLKDGASKNSSSSVRRLSGKIGSMCWPSSSNNTAVGGALDIVYMAEHHEMLKHVLVFVALSSPPSGSGSVPAPLTGVLTAEVLPGTSGVTSGDWLLLRLSGAPSPPLALPVSVAPGPKDVLVRNTHWEVKLGYSPQSAAATGTVNDDDNVLANEGHDSLLSAPQLTSLSPTSYTCVSCRLSLVSSAPARYHDLPSEHWEELVDAWMCHPEGQTLAKGRMHSHGTGGFWPAMGEALVGGSYILFGAEAVASANVKEFGGSERADNTCSVQCICGAMIGRRHEQKQEDGSTVRMYRFLKYAIRPISSTAESPKLPMSAFIVRDMLEHVQAHATYRFVFFDEEEGKPRLLIWLFKPKIRISYMLASPSLLPKSDCIDASKVLYKTLDPSMADIKELLGRYPGFPQAEYLFYPADVCRKLIELLLESTGAYPESLRTMTGLNLGWLSRA